jgi:uncharacterized protein (DUF2141 family)
MPCITRVSRGVLSAAFLLLATTAASGPARAADLAITVDGVASADGRLLVAVFDSAATFRRQPVRAAAVPAAVGTVNITIKELAPGDYAFVVYHDANANNTLDMNAVGIPVEDFVFSNNAMGQGGAPGYDAARFALPAAGLATTVNLR